MIDKAPTIPAVRPHENPDTNRIDCALRYYRHLTNLHDYVKHRWHEPFQLSDVAAAVGISPSRLSHLFLEKTGVSYSDWVRYQRIKRATSLLRIGKKSISEVAHCVGYNTARTFERSFRKITGMSAAEYRRMSETQILSQR